MCSEKQGNKFGVFLAFLSGGLVGSAPRVTFCTYEG